MDFFTVHSVTEIVHNFCYYKLVGAEDVVYYDGGVNA
jgi:hypothetical protein